MSWTTIGIKKLKNKKSLEPIFLQKLESLGKYVQSKRKSKILEQTGELINTFFSKLSAVPPNTIIAGSVNEFVKINGISMSKLSGKKAKDTVHYSLMFLNSLGMTFKYNNGKADVYVLTRLGEVMRSSTKDIGYTDKLTIMSIAGLLFRTKERILAEAIALNVRDAESLYKLLRSKLGFAPPLRPLIEMLNELKLTRYGTLEGYITETHSALSALAGIGMILYNREKMTFDKRGEAENYRLHLTVPLTLRLIGEYGDPNWVLLEKDYANKLMATKEEVNKLPKNYIGILETIAKEKDKIKAALDTLYEI